MTISCRLQGFCNSKSLSWCFSDLAMIESSSSSVLTATLRNNDNSWRCRQDFATAGDWASNTRRMIANLAIVQALNTSQYCTLFCGKPTVCTAHFDSMFVCEEQFKGLVEIGTDLTTTLFSRLADTVYKFVKVLNLMLTLAMLPIDFLQAIVNPTEREKNERERETQ